MAATTAVHVSTVAPRAEGRGPSIRTGWQPVDGDAVDPRDELVQIVAQPFGRQQQDPHDDAEYGPRE